jgi:hypothetical protein
MKGCTFVEARGEAVRADNIVTVSGRPYQHIWIREFLALLRGQKRVALRRSA